MPRFALYDSTILSRTGTGHLKAIKRVATLFGCLNIYIYIYFLYIYIYKHINNWSGNITSMNCKRILDIWRMGSHCFCPFECLGPNHCTRFCPTGLRWPRWTCPPTHTRESHVVFKCSLFAQRRERERERERDRAFDRAVKATGQTGLYPILIGSHFHLISRRKTS